MTGKQSDITSLALVKLHSIMDILQRNIFKMYRALYVE